MIKIQNLSHKYSNRKEEALTNINLHIKKGESVVLLGSSGAGKSTLLKCINRLVDPDSGNVFIENQQITRCHSKKSEKIRRHIGMIFQEFNLSERETVLKNVLDGRLSYNNPLRALFGKFSKIDYLIAEENIKTVGLSKYINKRVASLSGGEKQRVAIARALSQKPKIILADEPVSNLDPRLMKEVMDLLKKICDEKGITLVTSLHFLDFAKKYATRIIGIRDGKIVFDGKPKKLTNKDLINIYGKSKEWYLDEKIGF